LGANKELQVAMANNYQFEGFVLRPQMTYEEF
jgi:hypothetical protein